MELDLKAAFAGKVFTLLAGTYESNPSDSLDEILFRILRHDHVIFIDCDYRFDIFRLTSLLSHKLKQFHQPSSVSTTEEGPSTSAKGKSKVRQALQRIVIQKCPTSVDLSVFVLGALEQLLVTRHVTCIIVDSINSFYWHDRYAYKDANRLQDDIRRRLATLCRKYDVKCVLAVQDLFRQHTQTSRGCQRLMIQSDVRDGSGLHYILRDCDDARKSRRFTYSIEAGLCPDHNSQ